MFSRRFRRFFAHLCAALLLMHFAVAGYACPAGFGPAPLQVSLGAEHADHAAAASGCEEQTGKLGKENLCHQHYVGDQSVGSGIYAAPAFVLTALIGRVSGTAPFKVTLSAAPAHRQPTAPPGPGRLHVLRI